MPNRANIRMSKRDIDAQNIGYDKLYNAYMRPKLKTSKIMQRVTKISSARWEFETNLD